MAVRSGRYRHKITVQEVTEVPDELGQAIKTWSTLSGGIVWASVEPLQGKEYFSSNAVQSETTVRIRLRYLAGLTAKMRVSFDGELYNIENIINPANRNREIQLLCSVGVNEG